MKRIVIWLASTCTVVVLLFGYRTSTNATTATAATNVVSKYGATAGTTSSTTTTSQPSSSAGSTITGKSGAAGSATTTSPTSAASSPAPAASAAVSYTGSVAQTRWGPVQVQVTVTGSTVSAVDVLEYPSGNGKDQQINAYALPILVQETIDAQSAKIDMVSGATVTSDGYVESLQSALDQAGL